MVESFFFDSKTLCNAVLGDFSYLLNCGLLPSRLKWKFSFTDKRLHHSKTFETQIHFMNSSYVTEPLKRNPVNAS